MSTTYDLHIDGHRVAALGFNEQFSGPAVIFIHGITSSLNFWVAGQTDVFRHKFRWYSLSLPGHYPAVMPPDFSAPMLTAAMIADVLMAAIERLVGDTPVILIGHSTGGFAALAIAARYPDRIAGVASVSGFAQGRWTGALRVMQQMARAGSLGNWVFHAQFALFSASPLLYRWAMRAYVHDVEALYQHPAMPATLARIYPDYCKLDVRAMHHYFERMPDIDITAQLGKITAPALVIAGDCDPIVPPEQAQLIATEVASSRLVMLQGAGHLPMSERSAAYNAAVTDFVNGLVETNTTEVSHAMGVKAPA